VDLLHTNNASPLQPSLSIKTTIESRPTPSRTRVSVLVRISCGQRERSPHAAPAAAERTEQQMGCCEDSAGAALLAVHEVPEGQIKRSLPKGEASRRVLFGKFIMEPMTPNSCFTRLLLCAPAADYAGDEVSPLSTSHPAAPSPPLPSSSPAPQAFVRPNSMGVRCS
jgi:hypothetical protein